MSKNFKPQYKAFRKHKRRLLRALDIAADCMEEQGYHSRYVAEIREFIRRRYHDDAFNGKASVRQASG